MKCPANSSSAVAIFVLILTTNINAQPQLTVTRSAGGGPSPATLATTIADPNSPYTVSTNTATVDINYPNASTDLRAVGIFSNGNVAAGTSLQDPVDPNATFSGGVGIVSGICLSTGFLADNEPTRPPSIPSPLAVGVQGANNGYPIDLVDPDTGERIENHEGEVSKNLHGSSFGDADFRAIHDVNGFPDDGGDPAGLKFNITLTSPGFLRVSFVFGSDEFPAWLDFGFNDTIVVLVKGSHTTLSSPGENLAIFIRNGTSENFSLNALRLCAPLFRQNNMSPASVAAFPGTMHDLPGQPFYDHDFAGFSKVLTRKTARPLAPGTYTIKFVIEDVSDLQVDSALFIPTGGLKLFALRQGDYNGDGIVNNSDYAVWRYWYINQPSPADFYHGDGNGNGVVDSGGDYTLWVQNYGNTGNKDFCADVNRDGLVNNADLSALGTYYSVLAECASRFEGDADGDGDVDDCDLDIWSSESINGFPVRPCECASGGESLMAMTGAGSSVAKEQIPQSPDVDGDGDVDENDLAAIDAILGLTATEQPPLEESAIAPTPLEPARPSSDNPAAPPAPEHSLLTPATSR